MAKSAHSRFVTHHRCFCGAAVALFAATALAQTHRVEAPQTVTRAVAVYEWTGDKAKPNAARLVPVSLFIEGQFRDAGTYLSRPMPLALQNGNLYTIEKSGVEQGTFAVDYARHLQIATSSAPDSLADLGWFGYGVFSPLPPPKKAPALQASRVQPEIVGSKGRVGKGAASEDNDRPTFSKRRPADASSAGSGASRGSGDSVSSAGAPQPADDPDRPHFDKKPASDASTPSEGSSSDSTTASQQAGDAAKPATTTTTTQDPAPENDNDRPTLRRRDPKQAAEARRQQDAGRVIAAPGSLNDDPNRPTLHRATPAELAGPPKQLTGTPAELHQEVAVSDPENRPPHDFAREWDSAAERAEVMNHMQDLARAQVEQYARNNGGTSAVLPPVAGTPSHASAAARRSGATHTSTSLHAAAKAAPAISFTEEQIRGFTLSYGGLPTFVYTAVVPPPSNATRALAECYVTVVAQRLPSGELQMAMASVTDAAHLDRTPWMRLIDVVDPDASHRASLLFELRAHSSRQFALYRILSARAEQIFVTNPGE